MGGLPQEVLQHRVPAVLRADERGNVNRLVETVEDGKSMVDITLDDTDDA